MNPAAAYGVAPPGFRLPAETTVGGVRLQVSDLSRSIALLRAGARASGVAERRGAPCWPRSDDSRPLVVLEERGPASTPAPRRATLGLYHFAILVPDRRGTRAVPRAPVGLGAVAGMSDHAVSEAIYLTDPDGLGIEVYADRPRATWQVARPRARSW